MKNRSSSKHILLYTLTGALGDYLIMGDVMAKAERLMPNVRCLGIHRANPHTGLRKFNDPALRFFNIFSVTEQARLAGLLRRERRQGAVVMGIQMAPGSLQGFTYYSVLKKIGALDFIVDFNLINADIITPPRGSYILQRHLYQLEDIFHVAFPPDQLSLDLTWLNVPPPQPRSPGKVRIGVHPWSRRGHSGEFAWPYEKWIKLLCAFGDRGDMEFVVFGQHPDFDRFREQALTQCPSPLKERLKFSPSTSVTELVAFIRDLDLLVSVNTVTVHIAAAFKTRTVILAGPSLEIWTPQGEHIQVVRDVQAMLPPSDRIMQDARFPSVQRISVDQVVAAVRKLL